MYKANGRVSGVAEHLDHVLLLELSNGFSQLSLLQDLVISVLAGLCGIFSKLSLDEFKQV